MWLRNPQLPPLGLRAQLGNHKTAPWASDRRPTAWTGRPRPDGGAEKIFKVRIISISVWWLAAAAKEGWVYTNVPWGHLQTLRWSLSNTGGFWAWGRRRRRRCSRGELRAPWAWPHWTATPGWNPDHGRARPPPSRDRTSWGGGEKSGRMQRGTERGPDVLSLCNLTAACMAYHTSVLPAPWYVHCTLAWAVGHVMRGRFTE